MLAATSSNIGGWQRFDIVKLTGGHIALRSVQSGKYVQVEQGGKGMLAASRQFVSHEARFIMREGIQWTPNEIVMMSDHNNKYVRAGMTQSSLVAANSDHALSWERFGLHRQPGGKFAFSALHSGKFIRPRAAASGQLLGATSDAIGPLDGFRIEELGGGVVALRSAATGDYVRAGVGQASYLAMSGNNIGAWQRFRLSPARWHTAIERQCGHRRELACSTDDVKDVLRRVPGGIAVNLLFELGDSTFHPACVEHDYCYRHGHRTYGTSREDCDDQMAEDMLDICDDILAVGDWGILEWASLGAGPAARYAVCLTGVGAYYSGVRAGGASSYLTNKSTCCEYDGRATQIACRPH